MTGIKTSTSESFDSDLASGGRVLVEFGARWCQPCAAMKPALEKLAAKGAVTVVYVDVDDCADVAKRFSIRGAPTFIAFRDGAEVGRASGMMSPAALERLAAK